MYIVLDSVSGPVYQEGTREAAEKRIIQLKTEHKRAVLVLQIGLEDVGIYWPRVTLPSVEWSQV